MPFLPPLYCLLTSSMLSCQVPMSFYGRSMNEAWTHMSLSDYG